MTKIPAIIKIIRRIKQISMLIIIATIVMLAYRQNIVNKDAQLQNPSTPTVGVAPWANSLVIRQHALCAPSPGSAGAKAPWENREQRNIHIRTR